MRAAMSNVDLQGMRADPLLVLFDLETGTGRGDIFTHTNNPGSIKSTVGWTGKPSYKSTRVYPTLADGIADAVRLILSKYPKAAEAARRADYANFFLELERGGWEVNIDPPYSKRLASRQVEMLRESFIA
jgi:hypothetical protein